jgi:hypothetical protein
LSGKGKVFVQVVVEVAKEVFVEEIWDIIA